MTTEKSPPVDDLTVEHQAVASTEPAPAESGAAWYSSIGDTYAKFAAESTYLPAKSANSAEASKYYAIADRIRRSEGSATEEDPGHG